MAEASCPGRVCLGGEDLDWMGGHSLQAAVELRVRVVAAAGRVSRARDGEVRLVSHAPLHRVRRVCGDALAAPVGDPLDYPQLALACLAAAVGPLRAEVTIESALPVSAGLSSSAAVLLATLAATAAELELGLSLGELCEFAYRTESEYLRSGAGRMDFLACGRGGTQLLRFDGGAAQLVERFCAFDPVVLVGHSGVVRSTGAMIAGKRRRFARGEPALDRYRRETDALVTRCAAALRAPDGALPAVGEAVTACHARLAEQLHVSTPRLDALVSAACAAGAAGAKLTGGGGGGCMFALCDPSVAEAVGRAIAGVGGTPLRTTIAARGLLLDGAPLS